MEPSYDTPWEQSLARMAQQFDYPPTPDFALPAGRRGKENRQVINPGRRLAWAALIIALLAAGALAVPQARAAVLSFFARIGAIDIFIDETAPAPTVPLSPLTGPVPHSLTLFELGEPATFDEAQSAASFPLVVPAALGQPDEVYAHGNVDLPAVSLVWRMSDGTPLSLTEIGIAEFADKLVAMYGFRPLSVNGRPAVWLAGPHRLQLLDNWLGNENELLIESSVLIWSDGTVTYRLEGELPEAEMIAIAESIPTGNP